MSAKEANPTIPRNQAKMEEANEDYKILHWHKISKNEKQKKHDMIKKKEPLVEGQFKNVVKDGHTRQISAVDGSWAAGFHKEDVLHGKMIHYFANSSDAFSELEEKMRVMEELLDEGNHLGLFDHG